MDTLQEADISGYLDIEFNQSYPNNLGVDDNGNHRFQFSLVAKYINQT